MGTHLVKIWDKPRTVTTDRISRSVWRAADVYMDERHSTQDKTEGAAVKRWCEWVRYKGNGQFYRVTSHGTFEIGLKVKSVR
jgi:hypothetical protein